VDRKTRLRVGAVNDRRNPVTYLTKMQERKRFIAEFARRLREARPGERVYMRVGDVLEVEPRADLVDFVNQAVDFGTRIDFHPHRFHEERSDIAKDISDLARCLAPRRPEQRTVKGGDGKPARPDRDRERGRQRQASDGPA
jgi:hypothetical protein